MKFIWYWEYDAERTDKTIEKFKKRMTALDNPEMPKIIFGPFTHVGLPSGFTVYETDDLSKLTRVAVQYIPELKGEFVPLQETGTTAEIYMKNKK